MPRGRFWTAEELLQVRRCLKASGVRKLTLKHELATALRRNFNDVSQKEKQLRRDTERGAFHERLAKSRRLSRMY